MFVNAILSGPGFGGAGLWIDSLERDFGWTRSQLSIAFSLGQLESSVAAPIVGYLIDKYGGKKMAITGVCVASLGYICLSQIQPYSPGVSEWNDPLIFYIAYMLTMLGVSLGGWIPMTVIINNWFHRNRSFAMAIGAVGFSMGTFAIVPIMAMIISPENLGWRNTALIFSIVFLIVIVPIWRFIHNTPEDIGEVPDGIGSKLSEIKKPQVKVNYGISKDPDFSIGEAIREKVFWTISIGHGASSMLTATMMVHLILALNDQGLSLGIAALIWGISMGIGGISQLFGGLIGDRVPKRYVVCVFGCIQSVGVMSAVMVRSIPSALIFAVIYGIGFGARAPITTAMRGEYFGRKAFGKIIGISSVPMMLLTMAGPIIAGSMFDKYGDYTNAFLLIGAICFLGSLIFIFTKKPIHPSLKN